MNKRFKDAQICQEGACNPRPIANALLNAIDECRAEGVSPAEDCAVYLILHQLAFILTGLSDVGDLGKYMGAVDALELKLKGTDMKTHTVTVTVTAPNRFSGESVASIIERLIWIGKEDAEMTVKNGEGQVDEARDAMSLHLKFVRTP